MITLPHFIRLIRPKEWVKNSFVFAPLFFSKEILNAHYFLITLCGFFLFSVVASSIYVLNDLRDSVADRFHPIKKYRPLAQEVITLKTAWMLFYVLSLIGLIGALFLSSLFFFTLLTYFLINIAYCFYLKNLALIDIFCIATGFILRIIAGAVLIQATPSVWILICTGLLALFLALAKRRDDFVQHVTEAHRECIRNYNLHFIDTAIGIVFAALLIAYSIYSIETNVMLRLGTPHFYWTIPLVLFGMLRYLQITLVEERSGSPTTLLLTDKLLLGSVLLWLLVSFLLLY